MTQRTTPDNLRRDLLRMLAAAPASLLLAACGGDSSTPPPPPPQTRGWRLGFSPLPPRPTVQAVIDGIDLWSTRAELAIIHEEMPWTDLLAGMAPDAIIDRDKAELVDYLRGKGMGLVYMGDPTDGLSRAEEAPQLRALGRSLAEPAVQQAYRDYMLAVVRRFAPEHLGLAAETNLIRVAAPAPLYGAVVQTANDTAAAIRAAGGAMPLMVSVQVETAWGVLGGNGPFVGIAQDLTDFPFIDQLALSSYPYFAYDAPEDIPTDYYSRVVAGAGLPVLVTEGGWTSASVGTIQSSPDEQARYLDRQATLLDSVAAIALLHLEFADLDLAAFPPPLPDNLVQFASLGLTDSDFNAKPALARWDTLYARRLV
jgi:hypothetical protein